MMTLAQRGIQKPPLDLARQKKEHADITDDEFWSLVPLVHDFTELNVSILYNLYCACRYLVAAKVPGDFVECGVHMGGSIMMIEHVLSRYENSRRIFALDTFLGFLRRTELDIDIESGLPACQPDDKPSDFTEPATANMKSVGYERLHIVKGDILQTIPRLDVQQIALLRLDTDTYDTTKFELEQLYDRVSAGGVVIVDDYGYTLGCKTAVDDFISSRPIMLQRLNRNVRAWVKM